MPWIIRLLSVLIICITVIIDARVSVFGGNRLQVLLIGETAATGTVSGKNGSPSAQTAGVGFTITINATDDNWNIVSSTITVSLVTNNPHADNILPINVILSSGTAMITANFKTAGTTWTITAVDTSTPAVYACAISSGFTVNPAQVSKIVFTTPPRRLIAGTTVQYYPDYTSGNTMDTVMQLQTRDSFGNESPINENVTVKLYTTSNWARFNISTVDDGWSEQKDLLFESGKSCTAFYYKDQIASTPIITCSEYPSKGWDDAVQQQVITPTTAAYFSINHAYHIMGLSVDTPGLITVKARDLYQNIAAGDPVNGQYYTGRVIFWTNSSTASFTPALYQFTTTDAGITTFIVQDVMQETLTIGVTDYNNSNINGHTNDGMLSSENIDIVGIIVFPKDIAPEESDEKMQIGIAKHLYQGQGSIAESPSPVAMLSLRLRIDPLTKASTNYAQINQLRVYKTGTLPYNQITEVALYKDSNSNGTFEGDKILGDYSSAEDLFLSSAVFNVMGYADLLLAVLEIIPQNEEMYFLTVRIPSNTNRSGSLGLEIKETGYIFMSTNSTVKVAKNNFPIRSYQSTLSVPPETISVMYNSVAATYINCSTGKSTTTLNVPQGTNNVAMLMLGLWTNQYPARLDKVKVMHCADEGGSDSDIKQVRLWLDTNRSKVFEPSIDIPVTDAGQFDNNSVILDITNDIAYDQVTPTTQYYFITFDFNASASIGSSHGAEILFHPDFIPINATVNSSQNIYPILSAMVSIVPTIDIMKVEPQYVAVSAATQGDKNVVMIKLNFSTNDNSAILKTIKIDRVSGGGDRDIKEVNIYKDMNPTTIIAQAVLSGDTTIWIDTISGFPSTGTIAVGTEKMEYNQLLSTNNSYRIVTTTRGICGTKVQEHSAGATVTGDRDGVFTDYDKENGLASLSKYNAYTFNNGTVEIPLVVSRKYNEVTPEGQAFFVTYDIDYLAKTGSTRLGLSVETTNYFTVYSPDRVSTDNIPFIYTLSVVNEFPDEVTFKAYESTNTVINVQGINVNTYKYLMQGTKNNEIMAFTAETNQGDAYWTGIKLTRVGTTRSSDTDINGVGIWYDINNNAVFDTNSDVLLGSGTFNNNGRSGECAIIFSTVTQQRIFTAEKSLSIGISNRYFVSMDISDTATPNEQVSVELTNYEAFMIASPNYVSSTTIDLSYISDQRTIIPSPRTVTAKISPVNCMVLRDTASVDDTSFHVDSTAMFPQYGYAVVENEIISYTSVTQNTISGITRAQYNTVAVTHTSGTVISGTIKQGERNVPLLKLTLSCDNYYVRLYGLGIKMFSPGSNRYEDSDIERLYVYKGNDNNLGIKLGESYVGQPYFNDNMSQVQLDDPAYPMDQTTYGKQYVLITATPTVYYIAADISPTAVSGHFFGASIRDNSYFDVSQEHLGIWFNHNIVINNDISGGTPGVLSTIDNLIVNSEIIRPATVQQGDKNRGFLQLTLRANDNAVTWRGLKLNLTGDALDNDIAAVKVYRDLNATKRFENTTLVPEGRLKSIYTKNDTGYIVVDSTSIFPNSGYLMIDREIMRYYGSTMTITSTVMGIVNRYTLSRISRGILGSNVDNHNVDAIVYGIMSDILVDRQGYAPGLMNAGFNKFVNKHCELVFNNPETIGTDLEGQVYFITYDIYDLAGVERRIGISLPATSYLIIEEPDYVIPDNFPIESFYSTITDYPDQITFVPVDTNKYPASVVTQGDKNVVICAFQLTTNRADAIWSGLQFQRTGTGYGTSSPLTGTNKDVSCVKIYSDSNANDLWDISDTLISSGQDVFPDDTAGPNISISVSSQTITSAPKKFFVLYDIADTAQAGHSVGLRIMDNLRIVVNEPNIVLSTNLPFETLSKARIVPAELNVTVESLAPVTVKQAQELPLLRLRLKTNKNVVQLTGLKLRQTGAIEKAGTSSEYPDYYGEGDLIQLWVYRDVNNDGVLSSTDTLDPTGLVASVFNGSNDFRKGIANIVFSTTTKVYITDTESSIFITGMAGWVNRVSGNVNVINTEEHEVEIEIPGIESITRNPASAIISTSSVFPLKSGKVTIKHFASPDIEYIDADPLTPGVQSTAWKSNSSKISIAFKINLLTNDGTVNLSRVMYAVGTSSSAMDSSSEIGSYNSITLGWKRIMRDVSISNENVYEILVPVMLTHGNRYYVHLKAASVYEYVDFDNIKKSQVKTGPLKSCVVMIDLTPPMLLSNSAPIPENIFTGKKNVEKGIFTISIHSPGMDPTPAELMMNGVGSGVSLYELQERVNNDPVWRTIDVVKFDVDYVTVGNNATQNYNNSVLPADDIRIIGNCYVYRTRALNNAGLWSEWSPESKAVFVGTIYESVALVYSYPSVMNPMKSKLNIAYVLSNDVAIKIMIYDLNGTLVKEWEIMPGENGAKVGPNTVQWDGYNKYGTRVSPGGYIFKIVTDKGVSTVSKFLVEY
ncbi:MAG: hypothetical protein WC955_06305 [Elusimicrobiota bacterium]